MWLYGDPFSGYTDLSSRYDLVDAGGGYPSFDWTAPYIAPGAGRNGEDGLVIPAMDFGGGPVQFSRTFVQKNMTTGDDFIVGFAICVPAGQSSTDGSCLLAFLNSSNPVITVMMSPTGHISVYRGRGPVYSSPGTNLGVASAALRFGSPQYVEVKIHRDPAAGTVDVRINNSSVLSLTGQDTGSLSIDAIAIGEYLPGSSEAVTLTYNLSDMYICDTSGAHNNDFLGDGRYAKRYPNAAGTYNALTQGVAAWAGDTVMAVGNQIKDSNNNLQRVASVTGDAKTGSLAPTWATTGGDPTTDNHVTWEVVGSGANPGVADWMLISEVPADGDDSYLLASAAGDKSSFGANNPLPASGSVAVVQFAITAKKTDGGGSTLRGFARSAATDGETADVSPSTSYSVLTVPMETDPATGSPWTLSAAGAAEIGVKKES